MTSWIVIVFIFLATAVLGSAITLYFLPYREWRTLEGLFASEVMGVIVAGWLALLLAEFALFSSTSLIFLYTAVLFVLLLGLFYRKRHRVMLRPLSIENVPDDGPAKPTAERLFTAAIALWMFLAIWLFFRPHEYIQGGADAGVYISLGATIAQEGGFILHDEDLADLEPEVQDLFLRPLPTNPVAESYLFPGFYVTNQTEGTVVPQFYPLHPLWQAVAFGLSGSAVDGVTAELLISGLWMCLGSLAIVLTAKEIAGVPTALLVLLALTVMALQVWFARYPTTEALTQFLLWSGVWALVRWLGGEKPIAYWAFMAGTALGAVFLVRIDILLLLPIAGALLLGLWLRGWQTSDWWFALPFVSLVVHSFVHGAIFSAPYFQEQLGFGLRQLWFRWWLVAIVALIALALLWAATMNRQRYEDLLRYRTLAAAMLIGGFLVYAIYGWFVRPVILDPKYRADLYSETLLLISNHENWWRFGWYLSTMGVWVGVAGICLLIWRINRRTAFMIATGLLFSIVYLWNVQANPHHVYVMRRYVPAVVPFFLLAGAYFLTSLPEILSNVAPTAVRQWPRLEVASGILAVLWVGMLAWSARGFVGQVDNLGVLQQLADLNEELPPNSVLLFDDQSPVGLGDFWGTPLKYIFNHDAYSVRDDDYKNDTALAEAIRNWQDQDRTVIWVGDPLWLEEQGYAVEEHGYQIATRVLESSYDHKPWRIIDATWDLPFAQLQPKSGASE